MKIEVAKTDLESALQVVSIGTTTGTGLNSHFLFRYQEDNNQVEVLSNNNRIGTSMPVPGCKVSVSDDQTSFTVEAWRLNKWISAVEDSVLTLEVDGGNVKATSPKGSVIFQSLDPSQFSFWDTLLKETKTRHTVGAKKLRGALSHVKLFISDKDTTTPKLAVTEIKKGILQATDKGALAAITVQGLENSNLRLHGKDLGALLSYLSLCGEEMVEVCEHDRCSFLVRHDGGVLSVGRPPHAFPDIEIDKKEEDPHMWSLRKDEVVSAINALVASAAKDNTHVTFKREDSMVALSMVSASGKPVTLYLETQAQFSQEGAPPLPTEGFDLPYLYLLGLLSRCKDEIVKFGINPQMKDNEVKKGWVRFREDRDGDDYLTLLAWFL